ncbi:MAG: hypothetical protein AB7O66_09730 [Limisphaerales bacterium]
MEPQALIICPADRPEMAFLTRFQPLVLLPILGRPVLDLALASLATRGIRNVRILAADRPDQIRRFVRRGEAWGIHADVVPVQRELTPDEALARHSSAPSDPSTPPEIVTLDRIPPDGPHLWNDANAWFSAVRSQFEPASTDRVGMRRLAEGVFVHIRSRVSPGAVLRPPCWIGANSWIGPGAVIGPNSVVEAHCFVDDGAEIVDSFVGPGTYVGALTEIRDSLAWKRSLYKIPTGSATQVPDGFLLGPVHAALHRGHAASLVGRLAALAALLATAPILVLAWLRSPAGEPLFVRRTAVKTPTSDPNPIGTTPYHELNGFKGFLRRWPELWMIARGAFRWVGNRPLSPAQAETLSTEYERLWLGVPTGLFSLADAEGCDDPLGDEARAHSSFFAVRSGWRDRAAILGRILIRLPLGAMTPPRRTHPPLIPST